MKRSELRRATPLAAGGAALRRSAPLGRARAPRTAGRPRTGAPRATAGARDAVLVRAAGRCEKCGTADPGPYGWSLHHRRPRGMGGTRREDTPANLLLLCGSGTTGDHGYVESNRTEAFRLGYLVRQSQEPTEVPVYLHRRGWTFLCDDGTYA